jgi:hypothetical protein
MVIYNDTTIVVDVEREQANDFVIYVVAGRAKACC